MTHALRSPVRPAKQWMHVVSMALARVIAGRVVVSRRASPSDKKGVPSASSGHCQFNSLGGAQWAEKWQGDASLVDWAAIFESVISRQVQHPCLTSGRYPCAGDGMVVGSTMP